MAVKHFFLEKTDTTPEVTTPEIESANAVLLSPCNVVKRDTVGFGPHNYPLLNGFKSRGPVCGRKIKVRSTTSVTYEDMACRTNEHLLTHCMSFFMKAKWIKGPVTQSEGAARRIRTRACLGFITGDGLMAGVHGTPLTTVAIQARLSFFAASTSSGRTQ
jgi:hypothetical protein